MHAGATWALNQIVGTSPLGRVLKDVFPKYKAYLRLLCLAYYLVVNKDSALCNYEEFAECTWLPYSKGVTSGSISRLLRSINKEQISKYLNKLNQAYRKEHGEEISERRFCALNSTSITSYSANISSVDYGHNKDLIDAPQTNVLTIVDHLNGELIYFRNFDGNVLDVNTVRNTLSELVMMNIDYSNAILVTDRGYGSNGNWDDMLRNNMSFVSNARLNLNAAIKEIINEHYHELLDWNSAVPFLNQNVVTVEIEWKYDEFPVESKRQQKKASKELFAHLYYSKDINDEMSRRLQPMLCTAMTQLKTDPKKLTEAQKKLIGQYVTKAESKYSINMSKVDKTLRYAGVRVLVSDTVKDAVQCCVAYEERNQVEYAFNTLKARLNYNRTKVHSTEAWEGKLYVQMLVTAIGGMVRSRIKLYNETVRMDNKTYRVHYDSDQKLLAKLNNIYMTQFREGWIFDEVVGKKKELFKILNVQVPTVVQVIAVETEGEDPDVFGQSVDFDGLSVKDDQEEL